MPLYVDVNYSDPLTLDVNYSDPLTLANLKVRTWKHRQAYCDSLRSGSVSAVSQTS